MGIKARCLRILYVEDHAETLAVTQRLLRSAGHTVVAANSCAAARAAGEAERFDLLITDIGLSDGDGLKLLTEFQARYPVPGIVVSGYGTPIDLEHSAEAGFARHLTKPIEFAELTKAIAELSPPLRKQEQRADRSQRTYN